MRDERAREAAASDAELPPEDDAVEMASAVHVLDSVAEVGPNYTLLRSISQVSRTVDATVHCKQRITHQIALVRNPEWATTHLLKEQSGSRQVGEFCA